MNHLGASPWTQTLACLFVVIPLLLTGAGCASVFSVKSDPLQSDVFYIDPKSGEKKTLGKTPLELPTAELRKVAGNDVFAGEFFTIQIEKQGFTPERFQIPSTRFGTLVTALDAKLKTGNGPKEERLAKNILNHIFLAQKMANTGQFERAQIELDKVLSESPDFARALSMRGSIYFVQKNYAEALKGYEEALKADPQMEDAVKMAAKVRAMQGPGARPRGGRP